MAPSAAGVAVVLCIAEPALRSRVVAACTGSGIALVGRRDAPEAIVLADAPVETGGRVIAFATHAPAWRGDVRAVVPPRIDAATLRAVITVVAAGFTVAPTVPAPDAPRGPGWGTLDEEGEADPPLLTPREREVLALLAAGASNKAIARALSLSVHTAKFHVASLTEKLGASGRVEAVAIGIRSGLVMV
jgi:DNA-binding CsgD family transcriptional regulator